MKFNRVMIIFASFLLILQAFPITVLGEISNNSDHIEIEASPDDPSISPKGETKTIDYIDEDIDGKDNLIALFTEEFGNEVFVRKTTVAVQVSKNDEVLHVVSPSINGQVPVWEEDQYLEIPDGGYILYATDNSYENQGFKKFLATKFQIGDTVKLRKNGEHINVSELMTGEGLKSSIRLEVPDLYTVTEQVTKIEGSIANFEKEATYRLEANGEEVNITGDGTFEHEYALKPNTNYIEIELFKNESLHHQKTIAVFYQEKSLSTNKEVFLWVEQGPNAKGFQTSEDIYNTLVEAKDAGFTAVALDVKGYEGFASYQKNDLTNRPYISEITNEIRAGANPDLDLLEEFVKHARNLDLKIHASLNMFSEGSIHHNEFPILDDHLDWEEVVYRPEDNGELLRLRESHYGKTDAIVAFVNPAHPEVRDYQLKGIEEVIKNYDIDGIILDRGRYDNYFADFSEISKKQFEEFLATKGKTLENWPQDIFKYENGVRINGPLINDWYTYRASVITSFVGEVRSLIDSFNESNSKEIQLSSYVGSWYDSYYLNGTNWASPNFEYHEMLDFEQETLYTPEYAEQGYTDYLDFLMIGTYQGTASEIKHHITLGNIVTNGDIPLLAGMQLANIPEPEVQREVFQAGLNNTNGLMIFDLIHANFGMLKAGINDYKYVKDFQLGLSNPSDPDSFIEGNFVNINRNEGDINVYTEEYGPSTNASTWGVEIVVDGSGKVIDTVNKEQAISWVWEDVQVNNSNIPNGGFVISAEDPSGTRTQRQLVANTYSLGDDVRASVLSGYLDYDGKSYAKPNFNFEGKVDVLGPGQAEVMINGKSVALDENGYFSLLVDLDLGSNEIDVDVFVDGYRTNNVQIEVFGEETVINIDNLIEVINVIDNKNLLEKDFKAESWNELMTAYEHAKKLINTPDATQEEIDAAELALLTALDNLELKNELVNKEKLERKLTSIKNEKLSSDDYTKDSWVALDTALRKAKSILQDPNATQQQIDHALSTLDKAYNELEAISRDTDEEEGESELIENEKENGTVKEEQIKEGSKITDNDGEELPNTATSMYNFLLIGAIAMMKGGAILLYLRRKKTQL